MPKSKISGLIVAFRVPLIVFAGLFIYIVMSLFHQGQIALIDVLLTILLGSWSLIQESYENICDHQFGLDYIAILAVVVSLITHEYLVGAVIALMLSSGRTLEDYGASQARQSLTALSSRIPQTILVLVSGQETKQMEIRDVKVGQIVVVRHGEVIPLDGKLVSEKAMVDESSLTGEAYPVEKIQGDLIRSGTINADGPLQLKVTTEEKNSSYNKIIHLVQNAQKEKAPFIRLADRYSIWFTIVTFIIAAIAFLFSHTLESVLAVLVVATPCPLILATPIALIGGMNKAAKRRIIIKKLASLEVLSRVNSIIFDKTGTITLGKPTVKSFDVNNKSLKKADLLEISEAIERNSLHPLAKAVLEYAKNQNGKKLHAEKVQEEVGKGISGMVHNVKYSLSKVEHTTDDMAIGIYSGNKLLGTFIFEDKIKADSKSIMESLTQRGIQLSIFTGDKREVAEKLIAHLGLPVDLKSECKPEDKLAGVEALKKSGKITAMVGDGINDAPALALADVGMVFSNEEQTAASEAADVVFLGGNFEAVVDVLNTSYRTIRIAKQSILWGIGMSIACMIFAALGLIPPIVGAIIQEMIDVAVILNALRASR